MRSVRPGFQTALSSDCRRPDTETKRSEIDSLASPRTLSGRRCSFVPFRVTAQLSNDYLSRDVILAQHLKSFTCEHGAGAFRIVNVQSDCRKTTRPNQQRVSEMNIDLRHDQCREQFNQLRGHFPHFNHHHLADAETNIVFPKSFFHALRVARADPRKL